MEKPGKKEVTAVSIKPVEPFFEYITTEPYFNYLGVNLDCKLGNNTGVFQRVGEKVDLYTPGKKGVLGKWVSDGTTLENLSNQPVKYWKKTECRFKETDERLYKNSLLVFEDRKTVKYLLTQKRIEINKLKEQSKKRRILNQGLGKDMDALLAENSDDEQMPSKQSNWMLLLERELKASEV